MLELAPGDTPVGAPCPILHSTDPRFHVDPLQPLPTDKGQNEGSKLATPIDVVG